jgi:hypothetical protein
MITNKFMRITQVFSPSFTHQQTFLKKIKNKKNKALRVGVFLSIFLIGLTSINAAATSCSNNEDNSLKILVAAIEDYDDEVFRKDHLRRVMTKKAKSALKYQEKNEYRQAIRVLVNGVLRHADGCWGFPGSGANDHIIDCLAQYDVLDKTEASIREICSHSPDEVYTFVKKYWNKSAADSLCDAFVGYEYGDGDYGVPHRLSRALIDNTLYVRFAVAGDMQFNIGSCWDKDRDDIGRTRNVVDKINKYCEDYGRCAGVVVVGDLTQHTCTQEVIAFRQLFEDSYPGDDKGSIDPNCIVGDEDVDIYSDGSRINYGVYPLLGNHDDWSEIHAACDGESDCTSGDTCHETWVQNYIYDRMGGSHALFQPPDVQQDSDTKIYWDNYGWEWGSFHFLSLSIWPFYKWYDPESGTRNREEATKVAWLKDYLKALGKEKGIVIFQHLGWDSFSRKWWSAGVRKDVINVLCDRDSWEEPCEPYNIIAIISGHTHEDMTRTACTEGDYDYSTSTHPCPTDTHTFKNYIVNNAGAEDDGYGFMHVVLNGVTNNMHMSWENFDGDTSHGIWVDILPTAFLTWDTEEPSNSGGNESCAEFKSNGRWNDVPCTKQDHIACKGDNGWTLTNTTSTWHETFAACENLGLEFAIPQTLDEQIALMSEVEAQIPGQPVWINYVKVNGEWREGTQSDTLWEIPAPDNGLNMPWELRNEDCARFREDELLNDIACDQFYGHFACRKSDGDEWFIQTERGPWSRGHDLCEKADGYFAVPETTDEATALDNARDSAGLGDIKVWVNANDIEEEGIWVYNGPRAWVGWDVNEPNGYETENCAVLHTDGTWNDVVCQGVSRYLRFGCKNYNTGAWKITAEETKTWHDGFNACRNEFGEEWKFDVPRTAIDNTALTPTLDSIWINYTDEAFEESWVRGYWTGMWATGEPSNSGGNEDCAEFKRWGQVNDVECLQRGAVMCKCYIPGQESNITYFAPGRIVLWDEADAYCPLLDSEDIGDCYLAPPPDSSAALQEYLDACPYSNCQVTPWIRMYDTNFEGFWTGLP